MASVVSIPEPLPHQLAFYEGDEDNKVLCCGRRWGKSKVLTVCATVGHGPLDEEALKRGLFLPKFKGISHGPSYDIGWLSPNNVQAEKIWQEEIVPRFDGVDGCTVVKSHPRHVKVEGGGTLWMFSMEAPNNIRGARLAGMIVDEAKDHTNLRETMRRVVVPTLVDLDGWCVVAGTPQLGSDYNALLEEIQSGLREGWGLYRGKTADNSLLKPSAIARLRAEYVADPDGEAEELNAEILREKGAVFSKEHFSRRYEAVSPYGVVCPALGMLPLLDGSQHPGGPHRTIPFSEVVVLCDLAASQKQTADFTVFKIAGITDALGGHRRAVILDVVRERLPGPKQVEKMGEVIAKWRPRRVLMESVGMQLLAVQQQRVAHPSTDFVEVRPDKDKRSRSIPWARMLGAGEVYYPPTATWLSEYQQEHIRFTGDGKGHDDQVDTGSMLAAYLDESQSTGVGFELPF